MPVREERVLSQAKQGSRSGRLVSRSKALPCRCVTSACAGGLGGALEGGGRFALEASALKLATTDLEHAEKVLCHYPTLRKPHRCLLRTHIHRVRSSQIGSTAPVLAVGLATGCTTCPE